MIDAWPQEDRVATAWGLEERGGGSACNLAIDLRQLDPEFPVATIGLVGDDAAGRNLRAQAEQVGINPAGLAVVVDATTHVTDCFVSQVSGQRTHITDIGVGGLLSPDHFMFGNRSQRYFHLGLPGVHPVMDAPWQGDANGWVTVLKAARVAGFLTNLELCTVPLQRLRDLVLPCLPHLDLLIVNDAEIGALAGQQTQSGGRGDAEACMTAARAVLETGAMDCVVVHCPLGAFSIGRDGRTAQIPSFAVPADAIAGPNGAGDAFAAGFLYGLHEAWSASDSLQLGHAAAACSLRSASTTDGVSSWQDCLEQARGWGRREDSWPAIG
jgi:sugar/nucleoside kinase (ribokinase family)